MMDIDENNEILTLVSSDFSSFSNESSGLFYLSSIISDSSIEASLSSSSIPETHYVIQQILSENESSQNSPVILQVEGNSNATITATNADLNNGTYTIHLSEEPLDMPSVLNERSVEEIHSPPAVVEEISPLNSIPSLDKFMDVVTRFKCKFCNFSSAWKAGLAGHIRNCHLDGATFKEMEENCSQLLNTPSIMPSPNPEPLELPSTEEEMNEAHYYLCGQCQEAFLTLDHCKEHMEEIHQVTMGPSKKKGKKKKNIDKLIDADEDYFSMAPIASLSKRELFGDRIFRCTMKGCGHRFSSDPNLQYHIKTHEEKTFVCLECKESFEQWRNLAMHLWKAHRIDMDLHSCDVCGYKIHSLFKLTNHKKIHSEERSYHCKTCGRCFKQLSQLKNHSVIHFDKKNASEKRWYTEQNCDICLRKFSDSKCLKKHQQAVHSKLKPFTCHFCGHMSARKAMLQLHMRQHTGEKPFVCGICEYRTGDHNSLRRHKMRHTGTKPYKCPYCDYACIQAISYKTHLKNRHPGKEGLFSCEQCSFKSLSKDNYINHMYDHYKTGPSSETPTDDLSSSEPQTLHIPESTLKQLESILPDKSSAQLICSCLNALTQDSSAKEKSPTSSPSGNDSSTVDLDSNAHLSDHLYLAMQQPEFSVCS